MKYTDIKRIQLEQWLGDDGNSREDTITLLHELITGEYSLKVFREDVSSYDYEEPEPETEDV